MFCMNCGAKLSEQMKFCYECGEKIPQPISKNINLNEENQCEPSKMLNLFKDETNIHTRMQKTMLETIDEENAFSMFLFMGQNDVEIIERAYSSIANENLRKRVFLYNESDRANKKFYTAMSTYASVEKNETPILLYDDSTFTNGKSGVLLTEKTIYINNLMEAKANLSAGNIKRVFFYRDKLFIDRQEVKALMLNNMKEKTELCELLNFFVYILQISNGDLTKASQTYFDIGFDKYLYLCNMLIDMLRIPIIGKRVSIYEETHSTKTKFSNAMDTYAFVGDGEYPLILYDNSITGNGKSGILVTNKFLYASVILSKPMKIFIPSIKNIRISLGELLIEPYTEKIPITYIDSSLKGDFVIFLKAITGIMAMININEFQEDAHNMSISEFDEYIKELFEEMSSHDE